MSNISWVIRNLQAPLIILKLIKIKNRYVYILIQLFLVTKSLRICLFEIFTSHSDNISQTNDESRYFELTSFFFYFLLYIKRVVDNSRVIKF